MSVPDGFGLLHGAGALPRHCWIVRAPRCTRPSLRPLRPLRRSVVKSITVATGESEAFRKLGVEKGATKDAIKKAYRKMVLRVHPDLNREGGSEAEFIQVHEAYESLIANKGKPKVDPPNGEETWNFHDWHWKFRMSRAFDKQQHKPGAANPYGSSERLQPLHRHQVKSQLANLQRKAAYRNQKRGQAPGAAAPAVECEGPPPGPEWAAAHAGEYAQDWESPLQHQTPWSAPEPLRAHDGVAASGSMDGSRRAASMSSGRHSQQVREGQAQPRTAGSAAAATAVADVEPAASAGLHTQQAPSQRHVAADLPHTSSHDSSRIGHDSSSTDGGITGVDSSTGGQYSREALRRAQAAFEALLDEEWVGSFEDFNVDNAHRDDEEWADGWGDDVIDGSTSAAPPVEALAEQPHACESDRAASNEGSDGSEASDAADEDLGYSGSSRVKSQLAGLRRKQRLR